MFEYNQKFIWFDFETCNLSLSSLENKPWEVAWIITQGKKILEKKQYFVKWEPLNISKDAARITGFNKSLYERTSVEADKVLRELESYLYDESYMVCGHNILGFDVYIHGIFRENLGLKKDYSYINRCIDTNCLSKAVIKNLSHKNESSFIGWQYKLNNFIEKGLRTNITAMCKYYDIEIDESKTHHALYDVEQNIKIFEKIKQTLNL